MNFKNSRLFGIWVKVLERHLKTKISDINDNAKEDVGIAISQNVSDPQSILNEVAAETEVLKEEVAKTLNPEIDKLAEESNQSNLEGLQNATAEQTTQIERKISGLEVDIKRTKLTYDWNKLIWVSVAIISLCTVDAASNHPSFQVITGSLLAAILLSIAVAASLSFAAHAIGAKIGSPTSAITKRIWFAGGLVGGGIVFYMLGILRRTYLGDEHSFANSPFLWMCFNLFFFAVALIIASMKLPAKEERLAYNNLREKKKQLNTLKQDKEKLLSALRKEEERINECRQKLESFRKYRDELLISLDKEKERINAMCLKEFELKGGKVPVKGLLTSKIERP